MKIREVMQDRVTTIREDDALSLALQIMLWQRIRHLPVLKGDALVGLLSERDVLARGTGPGQAYEVTGTVGDAMRTDIVTITSDTEVRDAAAKMTIAKIGCLPVLEGDRLIGIVTTTDLLAELAGATEEPLDSDEGARA